MSAKIIVNAQVRSTTGKGASRRLRRDGLVPAIVYGGHQEPQMLTLLHNDLLKHLEHDAFYSSLIDLEIEGGETDSVVLKDLQRHPAKPFILHVDFMRITRGEKLRMVVPIHFVNEETCKGVKAGGQVLRSINELEIVCLPRDLPESVNVDLAALELGDAVMLSQLELPEGVELAHAPEHDEQVVAVREARIEEPAETEEGQEAAAGDAAAGGEQSEG